MNVWIKDAAALSAMGIFGMMIFVWASILPGIF